MWFFIVNYLTTRSLDILEDGDNLIPIEVKAGQTIATDYFSGIDYWQGLNPQKQLAWLIYCGEQNQQRKNVRVIGWRDIGMLE